MPSDTRYCSSARAILLARYCAPRTTGGTGQASDDLSRGTHDLADNRASPRAVAVRWPGGVAPLGREQTPSPPSPHAASAQLCSNDTACRNRRDRGTPRPNCHRTQIETYLGRLDVTGPVVVTGALVRVSRAYFPTLVTARPPSCSSSLDDGSSAPHPLASAVRQHQAPRLSLLRPLGRLLGRLRRPRPARNPVSGSSAPSPRVSAVWRQPWRRRASSEGGPDTAIRESVRHALLGGPRAPSPRFARQNSKTGNMQPPRRKKGAPGKSSIFAQNGRFVPETRERIPPRLGRDRRAERAHGRNCGFRSPGWGRRTLDGSRRDAGRASAKRPLRLRGRRAPSSGTYRPRGKKSLE